MYLYTWELFTVWCHPTKFGSHRRYGSTDIMILVCHLISQDRVIEGSRNFIGEISHGKSVPCHA